MAKFKKIDTIENTISDRCGQISAKNRQKTENPKKHPYSGHYFKSSLTAVTKPKKPRFFQKSTIFQNQPSPRKNRPKKSIIKKSIKSILKSTTLSAKIGYLRLSVSLFRSKNRIFWKKISQKIFDPGMVKMTHFD